MAAQAEGPVSAVALDEAQRDAVGRAEAAMAWARAQPPQVEGSANGEAPPQEEGGAAMFKQYAQETQSQGRAVHVSHEEPAASSPPAIPAPDRPAAV